MKLGEIFDYPTEVLKWLVMVKIRAILSDTSILPQKVLVRFLDAIQSDSQTRSSQPCLNNTCTELGLDYASNTTVKHSNSSIAMKRQQLLVIDKIADAEHRNGKAAKNDDAPVPEYLWNDAIMLNGDTHKIKALFPLRVFALHWWKRHVTKEFFKWLKLNHNSNTMNEEFRKDLSAGRDCIA